MLKTAIHCFSESIDSIAVDFSKHFRAPLVHIFEILAVALMIAGGFIGPLLISDYLPFPENANGYEFAAVFIMWFVFGIVGLVLQRAYMVCKKGSPK